MANKIRRIPLRIEELLLQNFQLSGHDGQHCIPRCEPAQLASTPESSSEL